MLLLLLLRLRCFSVVTSTCVSVCGVFVHAGFVPTLPLLAAPAPRSFSTAASFSANIAATRASCSCEGPAAAAAACASLCCCH